MKYGIKQRLVSVGDDFDIRDHTGKKLYFVDGKGFSFADDLTIKDMGRTAVGSIKQKMFTFSPTYRILVGGKEIATIRKKLMTFRPIFELKPIGSDLILAKGRLVFYDYSFYRGRQKVGKVSKKFIGFSDTYGVEIDDGENQIMFLAAAIVIDMVLHKGK